MSNKEKSFIVYSELTDMIEKSRKEKNYCAYLVVVLNEISQTDEMIALTDDIAGRKNTFNDKLVSNQDLTEQTTILGDDIMNIIYQKKKVKIDILI